MSKIAAIQMCSTSHVPDNLYFVEQQIEIAAAQGATLAVLPEMFGYIGSSSAHVLSITETPGSGPIQDCLALLAQKHKIWIVGGTIPLAPHDHNKAKAACLVFDSDGAQVGRYDKMHLFDAQVTTQEHYKESHTIAPGDKLCVIDTPVGKLGLCVCFDIRFPEIFIQLRALGAEIIAIPAAFTAITGKAHWELLARCRAIDGFSYIVGACQGGVHPTGRVTHGHSMIVDPWGDIIAQITDPTQQIIYADIDLKRVYEVRAKIPHGER